MEMIKIGRREFELNQFANVVAASKKYSEVVEKLGMNKTVQTTLNATKEVIAELNLNINHFTYKYTMNPDAGKKFIKEFELSEVNRIYYETFENSFSKSSFAQYKVSIGDFLEQLENIDFATVSVNDIENFVNNKVLDSASEKTKANHTAHIRSLMIYVVKNDLKGARSKVSKDMLIWLIG